MKKPKANEDTKDLKYGTILGIKVNSTSEDKLLSKIDSKLTKKNSFYIVTPNPEIILQAQNNPKLFNILNSADFSIPDGVGLKLVNKSINIIKGRDLMINLFRLANQKKLKVYLLGSKEQVIKKSLEKLNKEFPSVNAKGNSGPLLDKEANPVSEVYTNLQSDIVKEINNFRPHLLFVAFGAPKQELWISKWKEKLNVIGIMAVGGSFDYYSGFVKPVPNIFKVLYLEWLWRLIQEPKRIKRIFNAVVVFPLKVFFGI